MCSKRLFDWIKARGVAKTSRDLSVSEETVRNWLYRSTVPQTRALFRLIDLALGDGVIITVNDFTSSATESSRHARSVRP